MRLALFQPDIPQNTGAAMRLAACLNTPLDIIDPCGFPFDDRRLRRTAMDYAPACDLSRHVSWEAFVAAQRAVPGRRLVLMSTAAAEPHVTFTFRAEDVLIAGRESFGVPDAVRQMCDAAVRIPLAPGVRSLNVVVASAIVLAEARRQLGWFAESPPGGPG
ncbi:MAG: tRNA (cytidine(34)-2'-O)-methyltransferase [Rhodospirillaceae bacterium]|nr:tRNA (cytidine(34)-2'-O)-methyltransferase [Rhodospirillaceae bacterium]